MPMAMDNFLQLVPMEADADDSDSALVYGEEDDLAVHEGETHDVLSESAGGAAEDVAAQYFAPLAHFVAASGRGTTIATAAPVAPPPHAASNTLEPKQQRARFLRLLQKVEIATQATYTDLDQRLDAVRRIRMLDGHPTEQLAEYLPLLAQQQGEHEAHARALESGEHDLTAELLEVARQMSDPRDAEVALLAAFVFQGDGAGSACRCRIPGPVAPAIAALMDESNALLLGEHHQHPF